MRKLILILASLVIIATPLSTSLAATTPLRLLLVPGHEPDYGGAIFGTLKERDLTLELADDLQQFLRRTPHYSVITTRTTAGWNPEFSNYFLTNADVIRAWQAAAAQAIQQSVASGTDVTPAATVNHNIAPPDVALRLFGITKWANEHAIDLELHIHFNDDAEHRPNQVGQYSGFVIYMPPPSYTNGSSSQTIAQSLFRHLSAFNPVSNLPGESGGIVTDPDLIALGTDNTGKVPSILIEYSYLYEPQLQNPELRHLAIKDLAYQTYLGLEDYYRGKESTTTSEQSTTLLPYPWVTALSLAQVSKPEALALQTALLISGFYPPSNQTLTDCPRNGTAGPCTKAALIAFQKYYKIQGESGILGPKTVRQLGKLFK